MNTNTSAADIRVLEQSLICIGVAMGIAVLVVKTAEGNPWGLALGMALCASMIAGATWLKRRAGAAPTGYGPLLGIGIAGSSAVYALAVALHSGGMLTWELTLPMAMVTMTPAMLAAHRVSELGR